MAEPPDRKRLQELTQDLYEVLRVLARRALRRTPVGLDPTDLLHQAWMRIVEKYEDLPRVELLALGAKVMRHIAVDEARRQAARPAEGARITLAGVAGKTLGASIDLLRLDEALEVLRRRDERWARIVELRFFGGLSGDEVARNLGLSRRTVVREWTLARAWLRRELMR